MPQAAPWPTKTNRRSLAATSNGRKLAEVVAETIEGQIVRAGWPVGESLGSEPELLERFGVSRAVLREAVRIVENHRVAQMRRGPNGGLIVMAPDVGSLARTAALLLDYQDVNGENLAEARAIIEVAAVEDATRRIDEQGIEALRTAVENEATVGVDEALNIHHHDIHRLIASLAGNPALQLFVDVLIQLTTTEHGSQTLNRTMTKPADRRRIAESIHDAHTGIAEAMISGDVGLAGHRMRRHLQAMQPWLT